MTTAAPSTAVSTHEAGTYAVDPEHSRIAFTTRHLFGLAAVRGTFTVAGGSVVVAPDGRTAQVEAVAAASSFDTGDARSRTSPSARPASPARTPGTGRCTASSPPPAARRRWTSL